MCIAKVFLDFLYRRSYPIELKQTYWANVVRLFCVTAILKESKTYRKYIHDVNGLRWTGQFLCNIEM